MKREPLEYRRQIDFEELCIALALLQKTIVPETILEIDPSKKYLFVFGEDTTEEDASEVASILKDFFEEGQVYYLGGIALQKIIVSEK